MKKVLPLSVRKRALSEEEKALWHEVAKSTKPLRRRKRLVAVDDHREDVDVPQADAVKIKQPHLTAAPAAAKTPPPLAPLGRRERSRLAKGRNAIDARLDLHGMTQARAHRRLIAFLHGAHADGATFVLVITGKGRASAAEHERGVLRRQVPLWLALPDLRGLVVGFEEAHIGHGGEGALYVRLRRAR
jgi:DNA-nicking Smr family endonuclease